MNGLDFLSGAPKNMIFERNSNKTNLGGFLTLIYLTIVLLITAFYIYDFVSNNSYEVSYTYDYQYLDEDEFIQKRYLDDNYNTKLNFNFRLSGDAYEDFNESNFFLFFYDPYEGKELKFGVDEESRVYDLSFYLFYKCEDVIDGECIIREEDKAYINLYNLDFNYTGFKLDHQNPESPIKRDYMFNRLYFNMNEKITLTRLKWKTIIYKEEPGMLDSLFGEKKEIIGGEFLDPVVSSIDLKDFPEGLEFLSEGLKLVTIIYSFLDDPKNYYDIYSRKKKSIFDSIANICSLSLTIYNLFIFIFCNFYSKNFDNYKIIEKILIKNKKGKDINIDYNLFEENEFIEDDNKMTELPEYKEKSETLIDTYTNKDIIINEEESSKKYKDKDIRILPKLHFYDFFFNGLYKRKCCNSKKQELLSTCNEIIFKYYSVDYILYNQLMLENLFKDYKWNNPKLNNVLNNDLMNNLNL